MKDINMNRSFLSFAMVTLTALALLSCNQTTVQNPVPAKEELVDQVMPNRPFDNQYAVASANPLATQAGEEMLAQGGSAIDAAIAVQAVLSLVEPQSSGLGGGAFMLFHNPATGLTTSFDGRETAPASATPTMFLTEEGARKPFYDVVRSGTAVGVPGVVSMLTMVHAEHGRLPLETVLAPALRLAEDGFAISPRLHSLTTRFTKLAEDDAARQYFFAEDGTPLPLGATLKNPDYAKTLRLLMKHGAETFYSGEVADQIIEAVNTKTGADTMTKEDFAHYTPIERPVVCTLYRRKQVCSMGPPSSGGVTLIEILNILSASNFADLAPKSPEALHMLMEASRLAYADRNIFLADPDYMSVGDFSATDIINGLTNPKFGADRAQLIKMDRSMVDVPVGDPTKYIKQGAIDLPGKDASPEPPSTSHFSIMDKDGKIVSMTTTVEMPFGSHMMAGGMILNNQLTDFSFLPEVDGKQVANAPAPLKRPRSSMSPVIILNEDGTVYAAFGSPGGPAIIGYVAKTLIALLDWDMPLQEAIDLPNIVVPRGQVVIEKGFDDETVAALRGLGHEANERSLTSGVYGFVLHDGQIQGGADKRREGTFVTGMVEKSE